MLFFLRQLIKYRASQFLTWILTIAVVFSLILVAVGSWNVRQISQRFEQEITTAIELQQLSGSIIHLDEVLTMSARMAATTGDSKWEDRYRQNEPVLGWTIEKAIDLAPEAYESHAEMTDSANDQLVAMENQAFDLVSQGKADQALNLLFSSTYKEQKAIYAQGMLSTTVALQARLDDSLKSYEQTLSKSSFFSLLSFPILTVSWLVILYLVKQYMQRRQQAEQNLWNAKRQLEDSNSRLKLSEIELRRKASVLETLLRKLKQTQLKVIQSEKMSSLGYLVAGIAHEINNPVNFIHGNVEYLNMQVGNLLECISLYQTHYPKPKSDVQTKLDYLDLDFLKVDLPKLLNSMTVGTDRIREIVLSLRNFSRTDEAECKAVDIHEGLDSTLLILQHRLGEDHDRPAISLIKHYGDLPPVECYCGPLNQVFMNILSNAIDALEENSELMNYPLSHGSIGQIIIRTSMVNDNWVQVAIADTGPGMTKQVQEKMFEPFFTTKPVGKGTGMGMPISYQIIVERHKGILECISTPGIGTEFIIQIPLQLSLVHA
ncbi:MAG: ATP-binding protein [Cyanobacteria bacterium P01_F01_bin.150]